MFGFRQKVVACVFLTLGCDAIRVADEVESSNASQALVDTEASSHDKCRAAQAARLVKTIIGTPLAIAVGGSVGAVAVGLTSGMSPLSKAVATITSSGAAFKGVQFLTSSGVDALQRLLRGKKAPVCCCEGSDNCDFTGRRTRSGGVVCPEKQKHTVDACGGAPEVITFDSVGQTVQGCFCQKWDDCVTNVHFHRGHPWCYVSGCGYSAGIFERWDFCRVSKQWVNDEGYSALSYFIPQTVSLGDRARRVVGLRSWTDPLRGVAVGKSQCFVGVPEETLEGCASQCLEHGAPSTDANHNCTALAFHRQLRLCVRLANFVDDAIFTPFLRGLDGDGWQNFVLDPERHESDTTQSDTTQSDTTQSTRPECPASAIEDGDDCKCPDDGLYKLECNFKWWEETELNFPWKFSRSSKFSQPGNCECVPFTCPLNSTGNYGYGDCMCDDTTRVICPLSPREVKQNKIKQDRRGRRFAAPRWEFEPGHCTCDGVDNCPENAQSTRAPPYFAACSCTGDLVAVCSGVVSGDFDFDPAAMDCSCVDPDIAPKSVQSIIVKKQGWGGIRVVIFEFTDGSSSEFSGYSSMGKRQKDVFKIDASSGEYIKHIKSTWITSNVRNMIGILFETNTGRHHEWRTHTFMENSTWSHTLQEGEALIGLHRDKTEAVGPITGLITTIGTIWAP